MRRVPRFVFRLPLLALALALAVSAAMTACGGKEDATDLGDGMGYGDQDSGRT